MKRAKFMSMGREIPQLQRFLLRSVESQTQAGLPRTEHQSQKEAPTQHLAIKIMEDSTHQGETQFC